MQLILAAAPEYLPAVRGTGLPVAHAAYRIQNGVLFSLPLPREVCGGGLLLADWDGAACTAAAVQAILRECSRRRYTAVALPFPAPELASALAAPVSQAGVRLWVHEHCARIAPNSLVLVSASLSGGDLRSRLEDVCRVYGPERIVLDLQRLRMEFPIPCPTGQGRPLSAGEFSRLRHGAAVYYSRELGARYFTHRWGGDTRFVLFDDGDTLRRKLALARELSIPRGLLTLPECSDILPELLEK